METKIIIRDFLKEMEDNNGNVKNLSCIDKKPIQTCEEKFEKQIFDFNEDELLFLFSKLKMKSNPIVSLNTFSIVKNSFNKFFDYCVEHGYSENNVIKETKNNKDSKLSRDNAMLYFVKNNSSDLIIYNKKEIEDICKAINQYEGGLYLEGIIRSLYEGVDSTIDFILIKEDDINWGKRIVDLGDKKIIISKRLKEIFMTVNKMTEITFELDQTNKGIVKSKTFSLERFDGSLYKFTSYNVKKNMDKNALYVIAKGINSRRFDYVYRHTGYIVNQNILKNSNLLNGLMKYFDDNIKEVSDLILRQHNKDGEDTLPYVLDEINCSLTSQEVRKRLKPYFMKLNLSTPE